MMSSTQTGRRLLFTPLPDNKLGAIRLIKLFPGRGQEPIRGSLVMVDLDNPPDYEALSYRWESSLSEKPAAWIDDRICDVQSNLSHALFALRRPKEHCVLWIDYICIDQLNLDVKSRQIQLMGQIYSEAIGVRVWLGMSNAHTDEAFETINKSPASDLDDLKAILSSSPRQNAR